MKHISALLTVFCFAMVAGLLIQASPSRVTAQIVSHSCGCGSAQCGGCLKGKLFPIKKAISAVKPKKECGCSACQETGVAMPSVTSDVLVSREYLPQATTSLCGCGKSKCSCRKARPKLIRPRTTACPQCDCDFCELKVSNTTEKKKCFVVKQKEVCVPPVRLPWKKDCPPTKAKVRVVNVLGSKSYECPKCKYEWNVFEPEAAQNLNSGEASAPTASDTSAISEVEAAAPKMNELPDVESIDVKSVPRPPVEGN